MVLDSEEFDSAYDTKIEIRCKPNYTDEKGRKTTEIIEEQLLNTLSGEVLVFLRNTAEIIINVNGTIKHYQKEPVASMPTAEITKSNIAISLVNSNEKWEYCLYTQQHIITVFDTRKEKNIDKKIVLGLALPEGHNIGANFLYSFFRTTIKNPFNFLLNATFELQQNRNKLIDNDESNRKVIEKLLPFIVSSLQLYTAESNDEFALLKSLIIKEDAFLSEYGFYAKFIELISATPILPNVNGKFLRVNGVQDGKENADYLVFTSNNFAEICKGELFDGLIKHTADLSAVDFIHKLGIQSYKDNGVEYLCDVLNKYSAAFSSSPLEEKIDIYSRLLFLFTEEFGYNGIYPALFLNARHETITADDTLFVIDNDENANKLSTPKWFDLKFACAEQIGCLCKLSGKNVSEFIELFDGTPYKPYNFGEIIDVINEKFAEDIIPTQIIEINQWLFNQYKLDKEGFKNCAKNLKAKVLCGKKENPQIAYANETYFPEHYGNTFIHSLLKGSSCKFLVGRASYGLGGTEEQIKEYFTLLGVNTYPRLINIALSEKRFNEFFQYLTGKTDVKSYLSNYNNSQYFYNFKVEQSLVSLEHIETILKKPFAQLIRFFNLIQKERKAVFERMTETDKQTDSYIKITYDYSYSKYKQTATVECKSYLRWLISKTSWVDYKDVKETHKIAPINCSFDPIDLHGYFEHPYWDLRQVQKEDKDITENTIKLFLEKFGVINSISDLPIDGVYSLLDALPIIDKDFRTGRRVYDKVFEFLRTDLLGTSEAYRRFKAQGKVCATQNKTKGYYPISQVSYSNNRTLCEEILNDVVFFDFPLRKGPDKVETIFGVKKLNADAIKICDEKIAFGALNDEFQNAFKQLKPFIIVKRKQISARGQDDTFLKNSNVFLVDKLRVEYQLSATESKQYEVSDYAFVYVSKERKGYIVVPQNLFENCSDLMRNTQFADALAELICLILTVADGKESYRELIKESNEDREVLLEKDLGKNAIAMVNEVRAEYGILVSKKDAFYSTLKVIVGQNKLNNITGKYDIFDDRDFNFEDYNASKNYPQIISLFRYWKIDISQFNSNSEIYKLRISDYIKAEYKQKVLSLLEKYKSFIFNEAMKVEKEKRLQFFDQRLKNYQFGAGAVFADSVNFDFDKTYSDEYGVNIAELPEPIDFSAIIESNIEVFKAQRESDYNEVIKTSKSSYENYALLDLLEQYSLKISEKSEQNEPAGEKEDVSINYGELKNTVDSGYQPGGINTAEIEKSKASSQPSNTQSAPTGENNFGLANEAAKQENGFIAEYFAYKRLCEKYGEINVNWISKNSSYVIADHKYDDTKHYDISYIYHGAEHFVEVKKISPDELSFFITSGEVEFGEANRERYHIYCVAVSERNIVAGKSVLIEKFFTYGKGEAFTNNRKFSVLTKDFKIKAKIKK
jgi:hypothetical protein